MPVIGPTLCGDTKWGLDGGRVIIVKFIWSKVMARYTMRFPLLPVREFTNILSVHIRQPDLTLR